MTKEELIKLSRENLRKSKQGSLCECYDEAFIKGYELSKKRIAELKEENAELKADNDARKFAMAMSEKVEKQLREQLTKAKDHIKTLLDCLKQDTNDPQTNYYVCQYMDKAEQFIKEIEK